MSETSEMLEEGCTESKMSLNEVIEQRSIPGSPEPSCVSMKSQAFLLKPSDLSFGAVTSDLRLDKTLILNISLKNTDRE